MPHAPRRPATRSSVIEPLEPRQLLAAVAPGFSERLVAANIPNPTAMQFSPDGRLFVLQQTGQVRVIARNRLVAAPVLRIRVDSAGERGLLGIAFDPDFAANNFFYLYHTTATGPKINRVVRHTLSGNSAIPRSGKVIVSLDRLSSATNHNGGAIHFGPDGKLYIAVGENAQPANAQSPANRLGKILRYNPDGSIPADNPFFNDPAFVGRNKAIWAMGLRNPYTFAFQPGTGKMHINDVGQNAWEEVNVGRAGGNYGWPATEGRFNAASFPGFTRPIHAYANDGVNCAITGGAFYNPARLHFPRAFRGDYFFADLCGGWIRRLEPNGRLARGDFASGIPQPVDLKVGPDGALYYLQRGNGGRVYRITRNPPAASAFAQRQIAAARPSAEPAKDGASPIRTVATASGLFSTEPIIAGEDIVASVL
jgi:glucose/arabinose dehydrogenase